MTVRLVALAAAMLTIGAGSAGAQAPPQPRKQGAKQTSNAKQTSKKILRLEDMKVEGRIQKPQAMFLMPRANLNYGDLERAESFLPKVTRAAEREPF
jgi:hypothetical protein